jgi:hypothetical protein
MTIVAIVLAVALIAVTGSLTGLVRSLQRAHARREDLLLNQLLHVAGRPWLPAPASEPLAAPAQESPPPEPGAPRYTANPSAFDTFAGVGPHPGAELAPLRDDGPLSLIPADWAESDD